MVNMDILLPHPGCFELVGYQGPGFNKLLRDGHNDAWDFGSPYLLERFRISELSE